MESRFSDAVRREFAFLVDQYGFHLVEVSLELVRFESPVVEVRVSYFSGESQVDVIARLSGSNDPHAQFVWSGMVGRASASRLAQLGAEALRGNVPALSGDEGYYRELGAVQRQHADAWTAYYAGRGPQPTGKLP